MAVNYVKENDPHIVKVEKKSTPLERRAPLVATALSLVLAIIKLVVAIVSGSVALLASAVDSIMDMFVSVFNFLAIRLSDRSPDEKFPFGYGKIEALAAFFEGLVVTASGLYILYEGVMKFIKNEPVERVGASIAVMIISIVIVFILVSFLSYVYKKSGNLVIKSDLLHYKTDLLSNSAVLLSLGIIYFTDWYFIDGVFGIAIGVYIVKEAFELIEEGAYVLLDISLPEDEVKRIQEAIKEDERINDFHFLRTRQAGKVKFVEVHIVLRPDISLLEAHKIADELEERIKRLDENVTWHILIHTDPYDDSKENS